MINIDTRLLNSNELNENEFWLLMHIAKRINAKRTCFPNNNTLSNDTKFSIEKVIKVKKSLTTKGIISCEQRRINGAFSSKIYKVNTKFISIFVNIDEGNYEEETETTQNTDTAKHRNGETPNPQNTDTAKHRNKVLIKENEVLIKENEVLEKENTQSKNFANSQNFNVSFADNNNQMQKEKENIAGAENQKSNAKEKTNQGGGDFETFCLAYPNKLGKSKSIQKFAAAAKKIGFDNLMLCVENYKTFVDNERKNGFPNLAYKHLATFLNGSYEDFLVNEKQTEIDNSPKFKGISLATEVNMKIAGGVQSKLDLGFVLRLAIKNVHNLHNITYNGLSIGPNEIETITQLLKGTKYEN
jgi:hypothetical protein